MKVLFTVQNYYPELSGVPIVVGYLAEGLAKMGHEVSVVTRRKNGLLQYEEINDVHVYRFDIGFTKILGHTGEKNQYIEFVKNFACNVVILECSQCETTDLLLTHLDHIPAKKVFHSHGFSGILLKPFDVSNGPRQFLGNIYNYLRFKMYYRRFDKFIDKISHFVYLSSIDSGKMYLDKRSVTNYTIIENAADDMFLGESQTPVDNEKYFGRDVSNYFISVANYTTVKNQEFLLKAFYKANIGRGYPLIMIGSQKTAYYYSLKKLKLRLDAVYGYRDVFFLTEVPRVEIPAILEKAKLYLVSSTFEEYSVSIVEAMMKGIPFISSNVGNARVLPGGCVVGSEIEMANKIEELVQNTTMYATYSKKGREYALANCIRDIAINKFNDVLIRVNETG